MIFLSSYRTSSLCLSPWGSGGNSFHPPNACGSTAPFSRFFSRSCPRSFIPHHPLSLFFARPLPPSRRLERGIPFCDFPLRFLYFPPSFLLPPPFPLNRVSSPSNFECKDTSNDLFFSFLPLPLPRCFLSARLNLPLPVLSKSSPFFPCPPGIFLRVRRPPSLFPSVSLTLPQFPHPDLFLLSFVLGLPPSGSPHSPLHVFYCPMLKNSGCPVDLRDYFFRCLMSPGAASFGIWYIFPPDEWLTGVPVPFFSLAGY